MAEWRIHNQDYVHYVEVLLRNEAVRTEAGAMHYFQGPIQIKSKMPSIGSFMKSKLSGERAFRPVYEGSGRLVLEPSFMNYHQIPLNGETLVLDRGAYWASDMGVEVDIRVNKVSTTLFSGEGLIQTVVKGQGTVIVQAPGPIQEIELRSDRLVVDGSFAVARSGELKFTIQPSERSLLGTVTGGEFLVTVLEGTGKVWLAPVPNHALMLQNLIVNRTLSGVAAMLPKK